MTLIMTGFVQIFFVAINTFFIAKENYLGALICGFIISFIWSYNVKKVAFGNITDRLLYSTGAAIGCVSGIFICQYLF